MSKIQILPFKAYHVAQMDLREWDRKFLASAPDLASASADYFEKNSMGFTGFAPEGIVGAGGLVKVFDTNWEAWVFTTPLFEKYGVRVGLLARKIVDNFFNSTSVLRIQAPIDSTHRHAMRFAEVMGLRREGILRKYGPEGQDFYMFARVK